MQANRRGFLGGLLATLAATPTVKLAARVVDTVVAKPINKVVIEPAKAVWKYFTYKPILNSGAWDAQHATYDEAKKASDEIARRVLERGFK